MVPSNPPSLYGFNYVLKIVNEYSKLKAVKVLLAESEALGKFQEIIAEMGISKSLRCDNGKEFISKHFERYCFENKTKQVFTVPENNEQNGMAHRTILDVARCLLLQAKSPKTYWPRAIAIARYRRKVVSTNK